MAAGEAAATAEEEGWNEADLSGAEASIAKAGRASESERPGAPDEGRHCLAPRQMDPPRLAQGPRESCRGRASERDVTAPPSDTRARPAAERRSGGGEGGGRRQGCQALRAEEAAAAPIRGASARASYPGEREAGCRVGRLTLIRPEESPPKRPSFQASRDDDGERAWKARLEGPRLGSSGLCHLRRPSVEKKAGLETPRWRGRGRAELNRRDGTSNGRDTKEPACLQAVTLGQPRINHQTTRSACLGHPQGKLSKVCYLYAHSI